MPHADPHIRAEYMRGWRRRNADKVRAERKRYRADNLGRLAAKDRSRYLASRGRAPGDSTDYRWKLSPAQVEEIGMRYAAGTSSPAIATALGITPTAVRHHLSRIGIQRRSAEHASRIYSVDETAFDTVTDASAYWAGFLITDGCIHGNSVIINVSVDDLSHVELFRNFLGSNKPVRVYGPGKSSFGVGDMARFEVRCTRLCNALRKFGVTERKTHTAVAGDCVISNRHFWRGVIDGDGTVCLSRSRNYPLLSLCGASKVLIDQFASFCGKIVRGRQFKVCSQRHGTFWAVAVPGTYAVRIIDELYTDAPDCLNRKKRIASLCMQRKFKANKHSLSGAEYRARHR